MGLLGGVMMEKLPILCVTQLIERFDTDDSTKLFDLVQEVSGWLPNSVSLIAELESFNEVQKELINLAQTIVEGKTLTRRSTNRLKMALKMMQGEMLMKIDIVLFVTPTVKLPFNKNMKIVLVEDEEKCIDLAYNMQDELKYLLYMNNEEISEELENAVDIVLTFEDLVQAANTIYPIDPFTYDRLYLTAKLNKIEKEKSKILLAGSSYTMVGLLEDKMPDKASNVAVNAQDIYYTLLSVKEAIKRSPELDTVVISFAYYFFFSDMNVSPSDYMLSILSKVDYPVFNKLHGYTGELEPVYTKTTELPIYEIITDITAVRDIYNNALMQELEKMPYYNNINPRPVGGMLSYDFKEKTDEQNFAAGKIRAEGHNTNFDLDRGVYNQKLLDKFLDDMEELNKKVILFVPPATKFYRAGISKDMVNAYNQLVLPVVEAHKCCTLINLFESDEFNENDFQDYDHLNINGANKLSELIASKIKEEE